jgi:hypothetical protein
LDERTFLLTSYVDILVDERYNPSLKLHRLRSRPRLALSRRTRSSPTAAAATGVPWGPPASAVGMDEDESAALVARLAASRGWCGSAGRSRKRKPE